MLNQHRTAWGGENRDAPGSVVICVVGAQVLQGNCCAVSAQVASACSTVLQELPSVQLQDDSQVWQIQIGRCRVLVSSRIAAVGMRQMCNSTFWTWAFRLNCSLGALGLIIQSCQACHPLAGRTQRIPWLLLRGRCPVACLDPKLCKDS